jgi:dTDP-4-dehydrorhamnose reductase
VGPIVITGARGQLGRALASVLADHAPIILDHGTLDVAEAAAVEQRIAAFRPEAVFNTAAFNRVDDAEEQAEEAFRTNATGPQALARACRAHGAMLVHFSTDYVFAGDRVTPYVEDDAPAPRTVYGASKLAGEQSVRSESPLHIVIRTSALFGSRGRGGKGTNFVDTMLRLAAERTTLRIVDDQRVSPTSARDLAIKSVELLERWRTTRSADLLGLYHVTNAGSASWCEFAREIFRQCGLAVAVEPISTAEYGARAARPAYSVLAHHHLERLGLDDMRPWQDALGDYLNPRSGT